MEKEVGLSEEECRRAYREQRKKKLRKKRRIQKAKKVLMIALPVLLLLFVFQVRIHIKGDKNVEIEENQEYKDEGATASFFFFKDLTGSIQTDSNVDTTKIGHYEVTYRASFGFFHKKKVRKVTVVDQIPPVIKLVGSDSETWSSIDQEDTGYTATDNYDGDITDKVEIKKKTNFFKTKGTITYTVTDSFGNETSVVRNVRIEDIVAPVIELNGLQSQKIDYGSDYEDPGFTAVDDADGDVAKKVKVSGEVDTTVPGEQDITYTVTDKAGNEAETVRRVYVREEGERNENSIYLTFDDGPSETVTPEVLDILEKNGIKATFFILNYDDDKKEILQRMIDDGDTIGIHGYSHDYATIYASEKAFLNNIKKLDKKLKKDFDYDSPVIRFPGGSSNTISASYCSGVMTKLVESVPAAGYEYLDWNVDSGDANGNNVDSKILVQNVEDGLEEGRDNVVLMHDTDEKQTTADALQEIIDYGLENGYSFYAFDETTQEVHHGVNN